MNDGYVVIEREGLRKEFLPASPWVFECKDCGGFDYNVNGKMIYGVQGDGKDPYGRLKEGISVSSGCPYCGCISATVRALPDCAVIIEEEGESACSS